MWPAIVGFAVTLAVIFEIGMMSARSVKRISKTVRHRTTSGHPAESSELDTHANKPNPDAMAQAAIGASQDKERLLN
jgi:hypothetical protein